jgi:hypothetical protein
MFEYHFTGIEEFEPQSMLWFFAKNAGLGFKILKLY